MYRLQKQMKELVECQGNATREYVEKKLNGFIDVKDFNIKKQKRGNGHSIIYVNGFLSQKNENTLDWERALDKSHRKNSWYYLTWESKANYELGSTLMKASSKTILKYAANIAKKASRKAAKRIKKATEKALANLITFRKNEGKRLAKDFKERLNNYLKNIR